MRDEDSGSKKKCQASDFSLHHISPTLFELRNDESEIIAVMSSNIDDLLYGYFFEGAELSKPVPQQFVVGRKDCGTFRFFGKEFRQEENFGIYVSAKNNTKCVHPRCQTRQTNTNCGLLHNHSHRSPDTHFLIFVIAFQKNKA